MTCWKVPERGLEIWNLCGEWMGFSRVSMMEITPNFGFFCFGPNRKMNLVAFVNKN